MTLRFGLIGLGNFGRHYARLLQNIDGAELTAIANISSEKFKLFENILPKNIIKTTDTIGLINNPKIDCVVIASPSSTHASLAKQALSAGKHVLVEKPMAITLAEASELKKIAERSKNTFMAGHQYVYNDFVIFLKKYIGNGVLGKINSVSAEHALSPVRTDVGCFMDVAPHPLSIINYLFNSGSIINVEAKSDFKNGLDYATNAKISFESGLTARLNLSWLGREKIRKLTLVGENGTAVFDDNAEKDKLKIFVRGKAPEVPEILAKEPLRNQIEYFISCISTGKTPMTGMESSYRVSEWLDKVQNTIRTA